MHNLAIALKKNGHAVSGSDDEIFEPSLTRLRENDLLPEKFGWHAESISPDIDLIILGMHARKDNAELQKAEQLGITIMSYPEYIYNSSLNKTRVVIAGSHGKTSTTSMLLHVLKKTGRDFDFLVGAQIRGFDTMVRLSDAPVIILEGDEYFSSPIDMKAKFLWYKPHIALITGISWDHINVYPSLESYHDAFSDFVRSIQKSGTLLYCRADEELSRIVNNSKMDITTIPYAEAAHVIRNRKTYLKDERGEHQISVFGRHNLQNLEGARVIAEKLGIEPPDFNEAIQSFEGASNRLELIRDDGHLRVFRDFAHSPSKLKATVQACREQFPGEKLLAVMELHTFSSLNAEFLNEYRSTMDEADTAIIYYNPQTIRHKKLEDISHEQVKMAFGREDLIVTTETPDLLEKLALLKAKHDVLLIMSSGNFGGLGLEQLTA